MGLAASQGKMILLVQTRINQQYKLMDLSRKLMAVTNEQDDAANEYNLKLNSTVYEYLYGGKKTNYLNYNDLMGNGLNFTNGKDPVFITTSSGAVVVNGAYKVAIAAARAVNNSKLEDNSNCFTAFMRKLVNKYPDLNWYSVATKGSFELADDYKDAYRKMAKDNKAWITQTAEAMRTELNALGSEPSYGTQEYKDFYDKWDEILDKYEKICEDKGIPFIMVDCVMTVASGDYDDGVEWAIDELNNPTVNDEDKNEIINIAKYYYKIFTECINKGFWMDDNADDPATLTANLENGTYLLNGQKISADENSTKLVKDDKDASDRVKAEYDMQMAKLERQEKRITTEKDAAQTRLSAIETEIQSVQSFIDKNIERSFTYCQNA